MHSASTVTDGLSRLPGPVGVLVADAVGEDVGGVVGVEPGVAVFSPTGVDVAVGV